MICVYKNENKALLYLARNKLEEKGIDCYIKNEHSASVGGSLGMSNTSAELWLRDEEDVSTALTIIDREISSAADRPSWTCRDCEEQNDGSFEICWSCGTESPAS